MCAFMVILYGFGLGLPTRPYNPCRLQSRLAHDKGSLCSFNFENTSLLFKHQPKLAHLLTQNEAYHRHPCPGHRLLGRHRQPCL